MLWPSIRTSFDIRVPPISVNIQDPELKHCGKDQAQNDKGVHRIVDDPEKAHGPEMLVGSADLLLHAGSDLNVLPGRIQRLQAVDDIVVDLKLVSAALAGADMLKKGSCLVIVQLPLDIPYDLLICSPAVHCKPPTGSAAWKRKSRCGKESERFLLAAAFSVPAAGLEPARPHGQQILSLHRLPFRHAG